MWEKLKGKKTYILAVLAALYSTAIGLGLVDSYDIVWVLLGASGVATLRAGIAKAPGGS